MSDIEVKKDDQNQRLIPSEWRHKFIEIVKCFVSGDYQIKAGIDGVAPVHPETAEHIAEYISNYGATLINLPNETWESSICLWMGDGWDLLIDLYTEFEGKSDLVLGAKVKETDIGYIVHVGIVYVP